MSGRIAVQMKSGTQIGLNTSKEQTCETHLFPPANSADVQAAQVVWLSLRVKQQ